MWTTACDKCGFETEDIWTSEDGEIGLCTNCAISEDNKEIKNA